MSSEVKLPSPVIRKNETKLIERNAEIESQITPAALAESLEKIHQQIHRNPARVPMGLGPLFGQGKEVKEESIQIQQLRKKILIS